jgi:hypothetical protein
MFPPVTALNTATDGLVTVVGVAAAGSVPASACKLDGKALTSDGKLYVVYV